MIDTDAVRRATRSVRCPHCNAAIGNRCVVPSSGKPLTVSGCHPARTLALPQIRGAA